MRLIDADRLTRPEILGKYYHLPNGDTAIPIIDIKNAPTVDAVPLDRLCEWLANIALPAPCYYVENYCPYEDFGHCGKDELPSIKDCWKTVISKWKEEQDAVDKR